MKNKTWNFIFFATTLVIISNLILYIYLFGRYYPFWDQWEMALPLIEIKNNHLPIAFLFEQHNEHRLIFPKIVMLALAYFSDWNHAYELILGFCLASMIFCFSAKILYHKKEISDDIKFIGLLLISLTLFSIYQDENWLWGWQNQIFLSILAAMTSFYCLIFKTNSLGFFCAILAAIVASFSFANGLLVWLIGFFILLLFLPNKRFLSIWIVVSISIFIIYFYSYHSLAHHPSILVFLQIPHLFLGYVITFLGGAIFPLSTVSRFILGILGVLAFIYISYFIFVKNKSQTPYVVFGLCLSLFGILSAFATAVGRCGFGMGQGHSSRYTSISGMFWVGLILMATHFYMEMKPKIWLKYFLISLLLVSSYCNIRFYVSHYLKMSDTKEIEIEKLKNFQNLTDAELAKFYPNTTYVKERAVLLKKYKLSVFKE